MKKKIRQTLGAAILKFCAHQGLPHGTEIEVRGNSGKGRKVRSDTKIIRKPFGKPRSGEDNVAAAMELFLSSFIEPDLLASKCDAKLRTHFEGIVSGNYLLRNVRNMSDINSLQQQETDEKFEEAINMEAAEIATFLDNQFESSSMSEETFCRAVLRAISDYSNLDLAMGLETAYKLELTPSPC